MGAGIISLTITRVTTTAGTYNYTLSNAQYNCSTAPVTGTITVNDTSSSTTTSGTTDTSASTNTGTTTSTTSSDTTSAETYTINVTASSASDYTLSGSDRNGTVSGSDPSVTIKVGDTVNFAVSAGGHPFI